MTHARTGGQWRNGRARVWAVGAVAGAGVLVSLMLGAGRPERAFQEARPVFSNREIADARLAQIDADAQYVYWTKEVEMCSRMVDELSSASAEDKTRIARLAPYPGMFGKAANGRQDAALAALRARERIDAMRRMNDEALTPVVPAATSGK